MKNGKNALKILSSICLSVILVFSLATIFGCGGGGNGVDDASVDDDNDVDQPPTITGESGDQVGLDGTWSSGCFPDPDGDGSTMFVSTTSGSSFSFTQNIWINSVNCPGTHDVTRILGGTATLGDELTVAMNGSNVTATEVDIVLDYDELTILNPDFLAEINQDQECGFSDWEVGVTKDVLGTSCSPDSSSKDVIYIDDTADPDIYYSGDDDAPVDSNGYPTEIDLGFILERT